MTTTIGPDEGAGSLGNRDCVEAFDCEDVIDCCCESSGGADHVQMDGPIAVAAWIVLKG